MAGDAGEDAEPTQVRRFGKLGIVAQGQGARAHQAHVAKDDVKQLRQLVETGFEQKFADSGDAGVDFHLKGGAVHLIVFFAAQCWMHS